MLGSDPAPRRRSSPWPALTLALYGCLCPVPAQDRPDSGAPADPFRIAAGTELVLVHCNDFHGQVQPLAGKGGYLALHTVLRRLEAAAAAVGAELWLTNGGDWFQGTPEGNDGKGALTVDLLDRLGLDLSVLGNHEFDFGAANTRALIARTRHPVLAANLYEADGQSTASWVRPYVVRAVRGLRIGVLGLITSSTPRTSTGPFGNLTFGDEAEALRRWRPRLTADCDAWILLTHCGVATDRDLARTHPSPTLILGGHSHSDLRVPLHEGRTWIVQTGGKAQALYVIELDVEPLAREVSVRGARNLRLDRPLGPADPAERRWLDEATAEIRARWDAPLGRLEGDWGRPGRFGSTATGNLVADLVREAGGAAIGIQNKGGLRTRLRAGPMSLRLAYELCPFDNHVVSVTLRGKDLRAVLSQGLTASGRPFEVSGLRYEVLRGEALRVGRMWLDDGSVIGEEQELRVATNSFLARGGDGAEAFARGRDPKPEPTLLRDLLIRKLRSDGTLRADGEDRILIGEPKAEPARNPGGRVPQAQADDASGTDAS